MLTTSDERQRRYWQRDRGFRAFDHPVVELFAEQRLAYVSTWLDMSLVRTALDVGCGDGFSTFYMHRRIPRTWGVDRSRLMLKRHPFSGFGQLALSDIYALPFADRTFDLVYEWEVLHHVSDPARSIAEMARVSRQYVLLAEPNPGNPLQFLYALAVKDERWGLRTTGAYLRRCLEEAGMHVAHASSGGYILPNKMPMALARIVRSLPYKCPIGVSNWLLGVKTPSVSSSGIRAPHLESDRPR